MYLGREVRSVPSADDTGPDSSQFQQALVDLIVESWRFVSGYDRVIAQLPAEKHARFQSRSRFFRSRLDEIAQQAGLRISVPEVGSVFDGGLPDRPLNADEFGPYLTVVVEQVIEPTLVRIDGLIVHVGTVMLRGMDE